jgi:hypothetical protein
MTARIGAPKTGGRVRGSLDKAERQLLTNKMAGDILKVYQKLGGVKWLLEFAKENPAEFIRQALSRTFPAPAKDDPDAVYNTQINVGNLSEIEAARRVAFMLAKATYADPTVSRDITPQQEAVRQAPVAPLLQPEPPLLQPVEDPAKALWIEELPLTPEQRRDSALVRETKEASIESYAGSAAEQGHGTVQRKPTAGESKHTVADLRRRQLRRDELL